MFEKGALNKDKDFEKRILTLKKTIEKAKAIGNSTIDAFFLRHFGQKHKSFTIQYLRDDEYFSGGGILKRKPGEDTLYEDGNAPLMLAGNTWTSDDSIFIHLKNCQRFFQQSLDTSDEQFLCMSTIFLFHEMGHEFIKSMSARSLDVQVKESGHVKIYDVLQKESAQESRWEDFADYMSGVYVSIFAKKVVLDEDLISASAETLFNLIGGEVMSARDDLTNVFCRMNSAVNWTKSERSKSGYGRSDIRLKAFTEGLQKARNEGVIESMQYGLRTFLDVQLVSDRQMSLTLRQTLKRAIARYKRST